MMRHRIAITLAAIAALGFGVWSATRPAAPADSAESSGSAAWKKWNSLPADVRAAHVQRFDELSANPRAAEVLASAQRVLISPPAESQRLRELWSELSRRMRGLPVADRRAISEMDPGARGAFLYRALDRSDPAWLDQVACRLALPR